MTPGRPLLSQGLPVRTSSHLGTRTSDLLAGRMVPAEEAEARRHLASCRDCAGAVQAQRAVRATLRRLDAPGPRPQLLEGLLAVPLTPALRPDRRRAAQVRRATRPPALGRLTTAVMGTLALASAGAMGIAAVATGPAQPSRGGAETFTSSAAAPRSATTRAATALAVAAPRRSAPPAVVPVLVGVP